MKIFLTGGTGFIGKPLTRQLLQRGWQVIALVRNPECPQAGAIADMGATLIKGDVTDKESMRAGMTGVDIAINNAGWYEFGVTGNAVKRMIDINVKGAENFLSLAKELRVPKVVHVSSVTHWGDTGKTTRDETWIREAPSKAHMKKANMMRICSRFSIKGEAYRSSSPVRGRCMESMIIQRLGIFYACISTV